MNFMNGLYIRTMNGLARLKNDEKGSQTLEWIGIAAVIVILVGVISSAFKNDALGNTVREKFEEFIKGIG